MDSLLTKFISALDEEISYIEKGSRDQTYELTSGQREEKATGALYVFLLADAMRLPEDSAGTLKVDGMDLPAMVVAQEGNRIWLLVESADDLPPYLASAELVIDETQLLKRLRERIETLRHSSDLGLGPKVFGEASAKVGHTELPATEILASASPDKIAALRQCVGSDVTFLWGPPGTGKTFSIAALTALLVSQGETVLVTSHTHAAVEQALWALIERPDHDRPSGPLYGSELLDDGKVLKVGPLRSKKIPPEVHLDSYLEYAAEQRRRNIATLGAEHANVTQERDGLTAQLVPWRLLQTAQEEFERARSENERALKARELSANATEDGETRIVEAQSALDRTTRSFFIGRSGRVKKAKEALDSAQVSLRSARTSAAKADAELIRGRAAVGDATAKVTEAKEKTTGSDDPSSLEARLSEFNERLATLQAEIEALQEVGEEDANLLLENASAIFATLTKLYMDRSVLADLKWDTVIVDEASMAMPPLVALAASRAKKRLVMVGDMYQLPPIVRSPEGTADSLRTDIFELNGVTGALDEGDEIPQLAKLSIQRRMHPSIAAVAKELIPAYEHLEDDASTRDRSVAGSPLGSDEPLVVVDTADLNPWCGKMPGSLSRFNFLSGQIAVELAALHAAQVPEPEETAAPKIGIVTPYAAQRRYLNKLISTLHLERWISAGTVHTFQGNECEVIIFDSVLGDPHWTARFTNPHQLREVRRDLNVAVTRARRQLVFVGDFRWLDKHAKPSSGYGMLWKYLKNRAEAVETMSLLGEGFRARVAQSAANSQGWTVERLPESTALFTETDFYSSLARDLEQARQRVVLYTPYIGKRRWPTVEPHIMALRERGVEVYLLHKPMSDPAWTRGDSQFGATVIRGLRSAGVTLIPMSGVHAKTIVIDSRIVYEGSLNWASQTQSYEHMWRFDSKGMALQVERMLQLEPMIEAFGAEGQSASQCPNCKGPLILINQARQPRTDMYPVKLGCFAYSENRATCEGYLRRIDGRAPFAAPPICSRGSTMAVSFSKSGRPWAWKCEHRSCKPIRWARGDCEGAEMFAITESQPKKRRVGSHGRKGAGSSRRKRQLPLQLNQEEIEEPEWKRALTEKLAQTQSSNDK